MPGPIIRSGPSEKYAENWASVFGSRQSNTETKDQPKAEAAQQSASDKE